MEAAQSADDWAKVGSLLADAARRLQRGGADFVLLGTNTMHKSAAFIEAAIDVPFVHIADATADALQAGASAASRCWAPATPWSRIFTSPG